MKHALSTPFNFLSTIYNLGCVLIRIDFLVVGVNWSVGKLYCKMTVACQFFLIRLSCTSADGTESSLSATDEEKSVQSSSMSPTEKLDAATKSAVIEKIRTIGW